MKQIVIYIILLTILQFVPALTIAQETDNVVEEMSQMVDENGNGEAELSSLLDDLDEYRSQPIDINHASEAELRSAPFLRQTQVEAILRYRENFGDLSTLYELLYTNAFDASDLEYIQSFVILAKIDTLKQKEVQQIPDNLKHQLVMRWAARGEKAVGYSSTEDGKQPAFQGDRNKAMLRYRVNVSNWFSAGITTEKDAGEQWIRHHQPDFVSAHVFYKPQKFIHAIALGDFNARFGQGLILWNGFSFGKYSFPSSVIRYNQGISAFAGTDENRFLRGAATSFRFRNFELTVLGSIRNRDANVSNTDSLGNPTAVSSIGSSGTHATANQLIDRNVLKEQLAATHLSYRARFFEAGLTAGMLRYDLPVIPGNEPYKALYFNGLENKVAGADYRFVWKNVSMAGEYAFCGKDKYATIHTLKAEPVAGNSFALAYRNYSPDFKGLRSMAFGENSEANNENGWTAGVELSPISIMRITAMVDFWQHPWLKYRVNNPSGGYEYRLGSVFSLTKWLEVDARYRFRQYEQNIEAEPISYAYPIMHHQWQFATKLLINPQLKTNIQAYYNVYKTELNKESGYYVFNDWIYQPANKVKITFRQGFFNTQGYYSRIYAYEFNTPWAYSIPYLAGKGTRSALMFSYVMYSALTIYAKASLSYFNDAESTGSGDNQTNGPYQSEFNVLLNWRF
jgi:hypothetical protein